MIFFKAEMEDKQIVTDIIYFLVNAFIKNKLALFLMWSNDIYIDKARKKKLKNLKKINKFVNQIN